MPTAPTEQLYTRPFGPGEHSCLPNINGPVGTRIHDFRRGSKRLKSDSPTVQQAYTRRTAYLKKSRLGNPQYTYEPTPTAGSMPYWLTGWDAVTGKPSFPEALGAINRAYGNFLEEFQGETSSLGVAAAEGRETFSMVANRVGGLYRAYKNLRKGNFRDFLKDLSVNPKRKHRNVVRTTASEASGLWLEYWFGWSPTVADLYNTAAVISSADRYPSARVHGASGCALPPWSKSTGSSGGYRRTETCFGTLIAKTGATVRLVNPDLFLMNRLGLVNPAAIAWELVPFSFVVDWFTSFGTIISSATDMVGVEISDPYYVFYFIGNANASYGQTSSASAPSLYEWNVSRTERRPTLLRPVTTRPAWLNLAQSQTRAATAVSLLTQLFLTK